MNRPQKLPRFIPRSLPGVRAFTVVELLVTIGIIVVLMAILVPVIAKVRLTAQSAATSNEIQRISAGINNYFQDFGAYPGAVSNASFATGNSAAFPSGFAGYTQSKDLVMALLGGITSQFTYDPDSLGTGPVTFNVNDPSKKQAYLQKVVAELPGDLSKPPEFMDLYSDPRPLIYLRINPGGVTGKANIIYDSSTSSKFVATANYDFRGVKPYLTSADTDFYGKAVTDDAIVNYFSNTTAAIDPATSQARKIPKFQGTYIIFSAGANRAYGGSDDIVYGGGGGK